MMGVFFFSSRRRHTRWNCDWSSDVCSSDLRWAAPPRGGPGTAPASIPPVWLPPFAVPRAPLPERLERVVACRLGPLAAHSRRAARGAGRADACVRRGAARRLRAPVDVAAAVPAGVVAGAADVAAPAGVHRAALARYDAARAAPAAGDRLRHGPRGAAACPVANRAAVGDRVAAREGVLAAKCS